MKMVLTNYTMQCKDATSGKIGSFLFDIAKWVETGLFYAVGPVYADLEELYRNTKPEDRNACYAERNI